MLLDGRVAGISGIVAGLARREPGEAAWRWSFVGGLVAGGLFLRAVAQSVFARPPVESLPILALAGLLVGVGTRVAHGCTSGHGVCGNARLSPRSIAVTASFIVAGAAAVVLARRVGVL